MEVTSLTTEQIMQLISTQGLAIALVFAGLIWVVRVLVPRYLDGIKAEVVRAGLEAKAGLEEQTRGINRRLDVNTDAVDTLSALIMFTNETAMTQSKFDDLLNRVRMFRRKANGGGQ
jgi:hypothetical protein